MYENKLTSAARKQLSRKLEYPHPSPPVMLSLPFYHTTAFQLFTFLIASLPLFVCVLCSAHRWPCRRTNGEPWGEDQLEEREGIHSHKVSH